MKIQFIEKIVSQDHDGIRLDRCLRLWIPHLQQSVIEKAARKGQLLVEGKKAKPALRVQEGQTILYPAFFAELTEENEPKKVMTLTTADKKWLKSLIMYEDADLLVLNKPPGIAVQGGTNQRKSLDAMLIAFYEDCKPRIVHRLDLETSGVLVFAKTLPMARWLTNAFKERLVEKVYWALVCGVPQQKEGVVFLPLTKTLERVQVDLQEGLKATTAYRVIEALGKRIAWLELTPETGRTHQLRVHCAEGLHTPIMGDGKYGGEQAYTFGRKTLQLHARQLTIPLSQGGSMMFEAPLSQEMEETFIELGFGV